LKLSGRDRLHSRDREGTQEGTPIRFSDVVAGRSRHSLDGW